jgi:hypothetical protein
LNKILLELRKQQSKNIALRKENAALRKDLRAALAAQGDR